MAKKALGDTIEERRHYAAISLPRLYVNSFALATAMLKSNLFRAASGARVTFSEYTKLTATQGWTIEYKGEELRQDDLRVLLALIKERSGDVVSNIITLVPRTFCRETLKWADSGDSADKLRHCIKRLHDARVRLVRDRDEYLYSFISEAELSEGGCSVWLSNSMAEMFKSQVTYLNVDERLAMKDGLLSWMYGFIKADACFVPFDLPALRALAGSAYRQKDFNKQLKKVLESLAKENLIREFDIGRGKLVVKK